METFNSWDQGFLPGVGWVPSETETRQGCIQSRIILDEFTLQAALRLLLFCAVVDLSHLHMLFQIGSRSWCFEMERHGSQASEPTCVFMISEGCGLLHSEISATPPSSDSSPHVLAGICLLWGIGKEKSEQRTKWQNENKSWVGVQCQVSFVRLEWVTSLLPFKFTI